MDVRLRRLAAGICLLIAPVLYVAGVVADPALRAPDDAVGAYGREPGWVSVSASLLHWSWVLLVPGIIGMIHLVRGRAVVFGHIAGAVALLGVVNFSALMLGDYFYARLEGALGAEQGEKLADEAYALPGAVWGYQVPGFIGLLGLLVLGLVLAYGRQAPWWASTAILVGVLVSPMFPIGTILGGLAYLAGAGSIGLRMLRMSDAQWAGVQPSESGNLATTR